MGKGSFPEDNDAYLGMLGMHGRKVANLSLDESDCLIAIGCRFSDRTTGNIADFARNSEVIHIDIDPAEIGKNVEVDVPIVGDAKNILNSLINNIKSLNINKINENSAEWYNDTLMFKKKLYSSSYL